MGAKRTWKGKYFFLYLTCIIIVAFGLQGCTYFAIKQQDKLQDEHGSAMAEVHMDEGDNEEPSLNNMREVLSLFPEFAKEWQGKQNIAEARTLMLKGDYEASLKYNKEVLRQFPRTLGDQALFQMGLNYAYPEKPDIDNQKAIEYFQNIIEKFPKSSIREEAGIWILLLQKSIENNNRYINLQNQNEDLKNQIEKLKNIDLQIEKLKKIDLQKTIENNNRLNNLNREKENLKDQIEKLKNIDLGIEDKKRIDLSNEVDKENE